MLSEGVLLEQALGLQSCPDDLEGMGDGGSQHSWGHASDWYIHAVVLEFLVEHVVEASEESLLDAAGETSTKEGFKSLPAVDVHDCWPDWVVAVEVGELEASFDDAEGVGEEGADQSGDGRCGKIVEGGHGLLLEPPETCEIDIATSCGFDTGGNESFVVAFESIFLIDVLAWTENVIEEVVILM